MPKLRVATYNANNLFDRPAVMELEGFSATGAVILADVQKLSELLEKDSYQGDVGEQIVALLNKYDFHKPNAIHPWFEIIEVRGNLYSVKADGTGVKLAAKGRKSWLGWLELVRNSVNEIAQDNTARVIKAVNADILCMVEVESRLTLDRFNDQVLKKFKLNYAHNLLVDGNDPRGIDLGIYSQFEIRSVRSHIDDTYTSSSGRKFRTFSRDCAEYEVIVGNQSVWMLCNHFKSKGYGSQTSNNAKRAKQAEAVHNILGRFDLAQDLVIVAGDLNDTPDSAPLKKLMQTPNLFDVLSSEKFSGPRWTYHDASGQIDYLLVSKPLFAKISKVEIERRGIFRKGVEHFAEVTNEVTQASDHAAVWAEFNL